MRITSKGQVTIPKHLRDKYGLVPETEVDFEECDGVVTFVRADSPRLDRRDRAVAALRGSGNRRLSTDELLRLTRED
ncbi:AbrB/MazE/SpoVT family DNA-binding domain-containing protein [Rhodococcus spelaei]|uniref:AbrB/MazE/SpoVT family DNA-binding domain-containing protein n=1 Tax=Rhodococcus spelaei TaxID=2546320 RepID=A0A541B0D1_9NOCA|nr:AbrB/MazE/SpoVT family DNA-binding domain-containing protein [Rhodococcus spelaei]TQF65777.1 AbrB/MazE/SpoVT family DNA-binding domain-containing protein [Rhodococcus spelaei]